jgi:SAM-dependent methyltransferase
VSTDTESAPTASLGSFDNAYADTPPPWDIGRPQGEIVRLAKKGAIKGRVLDVGCGTGENALYLAEQGLEVWGVDGAPQAIEQARAKAQERGLGVRFVVGYALELDRLASRSAVGEVDEPEQRGPQFDTAIDSGMFHSFADEERRAFERSLASVLVPGGTFYLLCWSEHAPGTWGPRRVTQAEIRGAFAEGWTVCSIREAFYEENVANGGYRAWLAIIRRRA